jgi:hypothetical protein
MRRSGACITHLASLYCAFASGRIGLGAARATLLLFDKFIREKGFAGGGLWRVFWSFCADRWILDLVIAGEWHAERSAF